MKTKIFKYFLIITCLAFFSVAEALDAFAQVVYIDTDGSGDYNCDGTDDHIEINQALAYVASDADFTTVYLKGPNTYVIGDGILIGSNTVLEGDSSACITIPDEAGWSPLIGYEWATAHSFIKSLNPDGDDNITIQNFEIDGNSDNQSVSLGAGYYNMMYFRSCSNITVRNMYLHHSCGDGIKTLSSSDIEFANNTVYKLGHDVMYIMSSPNVSMHDNNICTRTNSGGRFESSNHVKIYNNVIYSDRSGNATGPGLILRNTSLTIVDDIEVYNNVFYWLNGSAIWAYAGRDETLCTSNLHIHHNIFENVGLYWWDTGYSNAAITLEQFSDTIIENNTIFNGGHAGIKTYLNDWTYEQTPSSPFVTTVRNNIIVNCGLGLGVGIWNLESVNNKIISENNCFYNNAGGSYYGENIFPTDDIYVDPRFADSTGNYVAPIEGEAGINWNDYHLQSQYGRWDGTEWVTDSVTSSCIDAGHPTSDYSNELSPNGDRINIGRYSNTAEASLSTVVEDSDTTSPYTSAYNPVENATNISKDTSIVVHIQDDNSGVDQSSIVMIVERETVSPIITGTAVDYTLTYDPPINFDYDQVVDITIDAQDLALAPNIMVQDSYSFMIESNPLFPALTLQKSVNKLSVQEGETLTYTITYTNTGDAQATNIIITDNIPTNTIYIDNSTTGSYVYNNSTLTWTIDTLELGASGSVSFQVRINEEIAGIDLTDEKYALLLPAMFLSVCWRRRKVRN